LKTYFSISVRKFVDICNLILTLEGHQEAR